MHLGENEKPPTANPTVALIGPELFPIPPIRGGGAELFIEQVAHRLRSFRPVIIGVGDPLLARREFRGPVKYVRIPLSGWRKWLYGHYRNYFPYYDRQVAQELDQVRPDLVHVHNRPLLAAFLRTHLPVATPVILHLHNLYESLGKRERPPAEDIIPLEAFFACSRFVLTREANRLAQGTAIQRVIYNGVDLAAFAPRRARLAEARRVRAQYGIGDEPVVLFAGKLREAKGVQVLLEAMAHIWRVAPQTVLVLAGGTEFGRGRTARETPFLKEMRQQIDTSLGRVVLTGFIPPARMPEIYLIGDVFAGPSQVEEGLGLVFLEAAAAGLPIVATRRGGIPEVVQDEETGLLLIRPDDASELAEKILFLLKAPEERERFGQAGRDWVRANFSWEKVTRDLEAAYVEVKRQRKITLKK